MRQITSTANSLPSHILFAGAGASASAPSSLPNWWLINEWIMLQLRDRLHSALGWENSKVSVWIQDALAKRKQEMFPPEYQAQIIEEMCGLRYFRALQCLDVTVLNEAHRAIALTAKAGHLRAIVTTNFDRLIEQALDEQSVPYEAVFDDEGYVRLAERLRSGVDVPLIVLKIHGCVSKPSSMIDTLKQRLRGRSAALEQCLDGFGKAHWLYLGFSAEDLVSNPDYLAMRPRASESLGGIYLSYPGKPETPRGPRSDLNGLGEGAKSLMTAHGDKAEVWVEEIGPFLSQWFGLTLPPASDEDPSKAVSGRVEAERRLAEWAGNLTPQATGLCLAAIFEAVGNAEGAARLLDKLVRKEFVRAQDREHEDYRALQLQYGRLGAAFGRFSAVPDLNGAASNASVETAQSLMRLERSERVFASASWLICHRMWTNDGRSAWSIGKAVFHGLLQGFGSDFSPRNDEELIDAWLAVAQLCIIDEGSVPVQLLAVTAPQVREACARSGDAIRRAHVEGLLLLSKGRSSEDLRDLSNGLDAEFYQAERVYDGFALGMRQLALARWLVGPGGLELARQIGTTQVANGALRHADAATSLFQSQGMDPWEFFALLVKLRACLDLQNFDAFNQMIDASASLRSRFPIFSAQLYEIKAQGLQMLGSPDSKEAMESAIAAARASGLENYTALLESSLSANDPSLQPS